MNDFHSLGLGAELIEGLDAMGIRTPTPIQTQAIPAALDGRDLIACAQTGTGKTAAFLLPLIDTIYSYKAKAEGIRALVIVPTRELALQIDQQLQAIAYFTPITSISIYGGTDGSSFDQQKAALVGGTEIIIATPGKLLSHLNLGYVPTKGLEFLVLDEADRMLDMGFIDDIRLIVEATPKERQTAMYSATFGGTVGRLAADLLRDPLRIESSSQTEGHADIEQRLHWADDFEHKNALLDHILTERSMEQAVVFTSTQRDADWLADRLHDMGHSVASLHGGMPQGRRTRVLQGLRSKHLRVLVATDVAARGIDVPSISHVINFGLPMKEEDYVHRIGRTGRAGRTGLAVTLAERRDSGMIHRIQRYTTQRMPVATIVGLEHKRPEPPKPFDRPVRPGGKPAFGARPAGKSFKPAGKTFSKAGPRPAR